MYKLFKKINNLCDAMWRDAQCTFATPQRTFGCVHDVVSSCRPFKRAPPGVIKTIIIIIKIIINDNT